MAGSLLTSADVARLLGVAPATVKRWADEGLMECERTAGGHRRFTSESIERFRQRDAAPEAARFLDLLLAEDDVIALQAELLAQRARRGAWWRVAEWLGPEIVALGERWAEGRIGVAEEHVASDRLARALARCAEALPARRGAPRVLLAPAEGEEHLLGLALVQLCLREAGWSPRFSGRATPAAEMVRLVEARAVEGVALSASVMASAGALADMAARVGAACDARGALLVVGGAGPWPEPLPHGELIRSFEELSGYLARVGR